MCEISTYNIMYTGTPYYKVPLNKVYWTNAMATSVRSYIGHTGHYRLRAKYYDPPLNDVTGIMINMEQKKEFPPITVLFHADTGMYEINDGREQLVCSYLLNYTHIPAIIMCEIRENPDVQMEEPPQIKEQLTQRVHKRKSDLAPIRLAKRHRV